MHLLDRLHNLLQCQQDLQQNQVQYIKPVFAKYWHEYDEVGKEVCEARRVIYIYGSCIIHTRITPTIGSPGEPQELQGEL